MEIRPVPSRFRQMLSLPPDNEDETIIIGAHIVRPIDPLPHFQAHQASCEGERAKLKKLIFLKYIYEFLYSRTTNSDEGQERNSGTSGKRQIKLTITDPINEF